MPFLVINTPEFICYIRYSNFYVKENRQRLKRERNPRVQRGARDFWDHIFYFLLGKF